MIRTLWRRVLLLQALAALLPAAALLHAGAALGALLWLLVAAPAWYALLSGAHMLLAAHHGAGAPGACPRRARWRAWVRESWLQAQAFAWQQPWRELRWPDRNLGSAPGVVLVHGYLCNRGFWNPLLKRLHAQGLDFAAPSLTPPFGGIDPYVEAVERAVRSLESAGPPILLAHSMGGLAVRAWLAAQEGNAGRVAEVIYLGSPHQGTPLADWAHSVNAHQMRRHSAWLQALRAREQASPRPPQTCIVGGCDQLVYPSAAAELPGATRIMLPGTGHVELAFHPATWDCLQQALRRARSTGASAA